ncbi:hypothetical protein WISP_00965 [Willisornis vidua]|uniref:Uncharacterized protein n=1 Tax=Willisornis vidua TaxID=1566151 RepID=A0ABQ9DUU9_9PASS|nr:hypothetical protein WISP_00965 [Willisornis vidua]
MTSLMTSLAPNKRWCQSTNTDITDDVTNGVATQSDVTVTLMMSQMTSLMTSPPNRRWCRSTNTDISDDVTVTLMMSQWHR